ncbi:MAG: TIGR04282 family arsenosugar biosynthesis glycosyltransferase, partial [Planctomycetota bacterium]|nr:TIGR04282 family arsenosugar biosynthesis glycosyltransferase [Planctomycetota bacterium]
MLRRLDRIIVMTRFPEPGKTKTRLIPALGSDRAAALHRCLIRHTLDVICRWAEAHACDVEVRYVGGDDARFCTEFGTWTRYTPQSEGSLGERMNSAMTAAFSEDAKRVVVIGTDCPGLGASHLGRAFDQLTRADAVIGPATDGGYYLLGMRRHLPTLFDDIAWGTGTVLQQTLERAAEARVTVGKLSPLSDVDHVEDLVPCRRIEDQFRDVLPRTTTGRISIIIPTLNEAASITATLEHIHKVPDVEIIVADGGSDDQTVALAQAAGAMVVHCNRGRGKQMNAG